MGSYRRGGGGGGGSGELVKKNKKIMEDSVKKDQHVEYLVGKN